MTILQAQQRLHDKWMELTKDGKDEEMMQALSIADTVLGNYNESLKADMVAMLEDLDLQIEESASYNLEVAKVQRLIRDRINKLKESKE